MAEKKSEFERRREAFEKASAANEHDSAIREGEALKKRFPDQFQADDDLIKLLSIAYNNRGNAYLGEGEYDTAIADYDKAIALDPDNVKTYHNRALAIGQRAAKKTEERLIQKAKQTEERLKQSYKEQLAILDEERKEQLASISNPIEINKFFEEEIANSKIRLDKLREEGKEVGETL